MLGGPRCVGRFAEPFNTVFVGRFTAKLYLSSNGFLRSSRVVSPSTEEGADKSAVGVPGCAAWVCWVSVGASGTVGVAGVPLCRGVCIVSQAVSCPLARHITEDRAPGTLIPA